MGFLSNGVFYNNFLEPLDDYSHNSKFNLILGEDFHDLILHTHFEGVSYLFDEYLENFLAKQCINSLQPLSHLPQKSKMALSKNIVDHVWRDTDLYVISHFLQPQRPECHIHIVTLPVHTHTLTDRFNV